MGHFLTPQQAKDISLDHQPLTFGKYKGKTPAEVSEIDAGYIEWMYETVTDKPTCSKTLAEECGWCDRLNDTGHETMSEMDPLNDIHF